MILRIKNIFILSLFTLLLSCSDSPIIWSKGTITGPDYSMCACCGGWFVEIEGQKLLMQEWPEKAKLQPDALTFPQDVKLIWTIPEDPCLSNIIIVKQIRLDK